MQRNQWTRRDFRMRILGLNKPISVSNRLLTKAITIIVLMVPILTDAISYGQAGSLAVSTATLRFGHTCVIFSDGTVRCWGENANGQLGNGMSTGSEKPVKVTGISSATTIAAGFGHTCAVLSDGTVRCWGRNIHGQLGDGTMKESLVPVKVTGVSSATAISAGSDST